MAEAAIRYEGLSELYVALKELDPAVHAAVHDGLVEVGTLVRDDATHRFRELGSDLSSAEKDGYDYTAEGFKVRVRPAGLVQVENTRRKTTGQHPEYGGRMVEKGMLPARDAKIVEAAVVLEREVTHKLREHGLT